MTVLAFPDILPSRTTWSLVSNTQSFTSPLSRSTQTLEQPGARWQASLQFDNLNNTDRRVMMAFLAKLRGASGRFYLHDHSHSAPRGIATGTPVVNGASQTGASIVTDGWTVSTTGILKAGDYFSVNDELKLVTEDINSDVGGNATIVFEPPLRASPADNAVITVTNPKCVMRLIDDNQASWKNQYYNYSSFTLACVESFT